MIIPHFLFVILTFAASIALAFFLARVIHKAIYRGKPVGCLTMSLFGFFFVALLLSIAYYAPAAHIAEAGPGTDSSRKIAIFALPDSFIEKYGVDPSATHIVVNRSERIMILYPLMYTDLIAASIGFGPSPDGDAKIIQPGKAISVAPDEMPDFFFEEPEYIKVDKDDKGTHEKWAIDYLTKTL